MANIASKNNQRGAVSGLLIAVIGLGVLFLGISSFGIWAFVSYSDAKSDVERKIAVKVAEAKAEQAEIDEAKFAEEEKNPYKRFLAPDDYCSLTFQYPKNPPWSEHWGTRVINGSDFRAYLNPGFVPPISTAQQFALRVTVEQRDFDDVLQRYDNLVQGGKLKQTTTEANGHEGVRLTGNFSTNIRGSAVLYKCRDKTIILQTDADVFMDDFEKIVKTLDYKE